MHFTPMSEEEAAAQSADLWPDAIYDYEVRDASEETSAAGNAMTKMEVWIYNQAGSRRLLFDYLVASEKAAWKIRSFCESCNLLEQYKTGALMVADIVGRTGRCQVVTQKADGAYPAKNVIRGYVKTKAAAPVSGSGTAPHRTKVPAGDIDDEIPFAPCWQ